MDDGALAKAGVGSLPPTDAPMIMLTGVGKRYGDVVALAGIDAAIRGRVVGLLGPNGAGKSTLLRCLLGLVGFSGQARVLGLDPAREGAAIRDRVGYMPERDAFVSGPSAVELCTYAAELSGLPRSEAMQRAHAALFYAGLEDKRYQPVESYSTGMKQRVKLACALVHDPELLFLDEPTNGLDPRSRDELLDLIAEMPERRGCAVVLSTHLLPDVDRICDAVVIMHRGRLRFAGSIEALRAGPVVAAGAAYEVEVKAGAQALAEALSAAGAAARATSPVALTVTLTAATPTRLVFETAQRLGVQLRGLVVERESMEEAFLRVIDDGGGASREVAS
jgi:ABC-2 type transport system ATP-binding protein